MGSESRRTRRVDFLVNTTYWAVIVAIVYFVFKYLLRLLMPFFLALVFAALVRPISHYLSRETRYVKNEKGEKVLVRRRVRMNRTLAGILSVVVLFLVAGGILVLVVIRVSDTAAALISSVPVLPVSLPPVQPLRTAQKLRCLKKRRPLRAAARIML